MSTRRGRNWWVAAAIVLMGLGVLSAVQSLGYWLSTAVTGEPAAFMFIDHAGPAVTSGLIAIAFFILGGLALVAARRPAGAG
ncbi:hypothetical protein GCM10009819_20080 [Agromyces tropicus]|uniref:Uncharacterized protein n=1 Tax=Agromyces tropicus TaxID=555371 RepID=A0ABN2UGH7_9MICO